jgi:hypothetical protein
MAETTILVGSVAAGASMAYTVGCLTNWQRVKTSFWRHFTRSICEHLLFDQIDADRVTCLLRFITRQIKDQKYSDWNVRAVKEDTKVSHLRIPSVQFSLILEYDQKHNAFEVDVIPKLNEGGSVTGFEFWTCPRFFQNSLECYQQMSELLDEIGNGKRLDMNTPHRA